MVTGTVDFQFDGALALVTLCQPGRFNAMSRAMWRQLELGFAELALRPGLRCVVLCGAGGNFCAGGDISEYPEFRFERQSLQDFHENTVWGALQAMLDCNLPMVARIDGNCIGAGLEIASCCDIRIGARSARFGAPIARLGFPMAPRELQLVLAQVGVTTLTPSSSFSLDQASPPSGFKLGKCDPAMVNYGCLSSPRRASLPLSGPDQRVRPKA